MPESSGSWIDALTAMEARLDAAERGEPLAPFTPPEVEGALPAELAGRAEVVVARGAEVQERLEAESARIKRELRRMPRIAATGGGAARFVVDA